MNDTIRCDRTLIIGLLMLIIGLGLVAISARGLDSSVGAIFPIELQNWTWNWLSNLGVGLVAAGILTITLERAGRKRHRQDVQEIKDAQFEATIKRMMPEEVFDQLQSHVMRVPFLRTNLKITFSLDWMENSDKKYLFLSRTDIYEVKRFSKTLEKYIISPMEEKLYEKEFAGIARIKKISILYSDSEKPDIFDDNRLEKEEYLENTDQYIRAKVPIELKSEKTAQITIQVENITESKDVYPFVVINPTIDLTITVVHPKDLAVHARLRHPSMYAFKPDIKEPTVKTWNLKAALLPYQGVQLNWFPEPMSDEVPQNSDVAMHVDSTLA